MFGLLDTDMKIQRFYHLSESRSTLDSSNANHAFSDNVRGKAGLSYHSSDYDRGVLSELTEYGISLNLGLNYRVMSNDLNLGYTMTHHASDSAFREFDRHRLWAGISVTFKLH